MFRLKIFFITLLFLPSAFSLECPSGKKVEEIALDMIKAELSGVQLEEMENSKCLEQKHFPHLLIVKDPSNEVSKPTLGYVSDIKDIKIKKVETIDPTVHSYKAYFEAKYSKIKDGKPAVLTDSITFFLYKDSPNQSIYGCWGVTQHASKILLFKKCK